MSVLILGGTAEARDLADPTLWTPVSRLVTSLAVESRALDPAGR